MHHLPHPSPLPLSSLFVPFGSSSRSVRARSPEVRVDLFVSISSPVVHLSTFPSNRIASSIDITLVITSTQPTQDRPLISLTSHLRQVAHPSHLSLLTMRSAFALSFLASVALAAPVRLPMPLARWGMFETVAERGLISGVLDTVGSVPIVGDVLDTVGDIPIVGDVVDSTVALLDPLVGVPLGLGLHLDIDTWLKCGLVSGLFGGRQYDLGCTCAGTSGGILLEVDVEAVVNVAGLDAWVRAEVSWRHGDIVASR